MLKKGFFDAVFTHGGTLPTSKVKGVLRYTLGLFVEEQYQYKAPTFKNRLFHIGFDDWMLIGIDQLKDEFAREHPNLAEWRESDKSYMQLVREHRVPRMQFYNYLRRRGFKSHKVALRRFESEDWKRWEREGVKRMLADFCDNQ